ncbi:MAG TPA: glycosyltransferase [Candidatus Methylacidiphilales bacterium]|jgi:alpha-N-acetylglucosamine transferase|nr:glycosyltransferase [Candidatus Methylacidiphilales bacterium]
MTSAIALTPRRRHAFATFLCGDDPRYLTAARLLVWQLRCAPKTCSPDVPVVVLVTPEVPESHRKQLIELGSIVHVVEPLSALGWGPPGDARWKQVLAKLRLWEMIEHDRIAFLDADTILLQPMSGIFDDPATADGATGEGAVRFDEGQPPGSYVFAAITQIHFTHESWPPGCPNENYLNSGCFVLRPCRALFEHYLALLRTSDGRINQTFPDQNLLNYAHRRDGPMPWRALNPRWHVQYPTVEDLIATRNVAALHDKWWKPENVNAGEGLSTLYRKLIASLNAAKYH